MRPIKFRAWIKDEKRMSYKVNVYSDGSFACVELGEVTAIQYGVLMQFTGLKDSKGTEIHEGDIVKSKDFDGYRLIEWDCQLAMFIVNDFGSNKKVEVIGNIYENPELLKEKVISAGYNQAKKEIRERGKEVLGGEVRNR